MKRLPTFLRNVLLVLAVAVAAQALFNGISALDGDRTPVQPDGAPQDWAADRAGRVLTKIETEYAEQDLYRRTPIPLGFSRALSAHFTRAGGKVEINFETGRIGVSVGGLDPLPEGAAYEVWLVENAPGPRNSAAIDFGANGDRIWNLGVLSGTGSLVISVDVEELAAFRADMAAVMQIAPDREPEFVIGGMQSIRFQIGREARMDSQRSTETVLSAGLVLAGVTRLAMAPAQGKGSGGGSKGKPNLTALIAQGRELFSDSSRGATFGGNGRTCATCHRLGAGEPELTVDAAFIAKLPQDDRLFIINSDLPPFDPQLPSRPAFESPDLMRRSGLILENIDGFDVDPSGNLLRSPVFRMTPALFNLGFTAPYGDSACCLDLQMFSTGAVVQHFTKTLNRVAGRDFVLPTTQELQALEAFMLSLMSPADGDFKISGRNSLLSTSQDRKAVDTSRREVRGRDLFLATNSCVTCHLNSVFSGGAANLDTGVEAFGRTLGRTPTLDDGDGLGRFQIPPLFGLRKTHFFHNGVAGNRPGPILGETALFTNLRDAVSFYTTDEFKASAEGLLLLPDGSRRFERLFIMAPGEIDDIAAFLEAISKP